MNNGNEAAARASAKPSSSTSAQSKDGQSASSELIRSGMVQRRSSSPHGSAALPPGMFFNRELSWLQFNSRVLAEAEEPGNPLLERVKFLAIHASNLDEFFMIRVAGVKSKVNAGIAEPGPDGRTTTAQYALIRTHSAQQMTQAASLFSRKLVPVLKRDGIAIKPTGSLNNRQQAELELVFQRDVFPVLTPQAVDRARRFPHISNDSLNLMVVLRAPGDANRFARVKVPAVLPRLIRLGVAHRFPLEPDRKAVFVWLEDVIAAHLQQLFPGNDVVAAYPFHVTRDSDIEFDEDDEEAHDLLKAMRELLSERTFGSVVKLTVDTTMPEDLRKWLAEQLGATEREIYIVDGPLALTDSRELLKLDRPDLKDPAFTPSPISRAFGGPAPLDSNSWATQDLFALIRERDVLIHHPYQSFAAVSDFLKVAATDPDVVAIKQVLYRIGRDSPLVPTLIEARDDDTQVAVLVELKARFDEESNITWAQQLEQHGVHVAYGVAGLKTHCKLTLVVRREREGLCRYAHLATGNYNATTARLYEDIGLFTARPELTSDVSELFNVLTGYSHQDTYRKLWVAPTGLRRQVVEAIHTEINLHKRQGGGRLIFKMNALVDRELVRVLYTASQAGVEIDLIIRGACCIRPGVPGWSETIRVRSVIGRFLEHSRIYSFGNGGSPIIMLGSADLMERNLDRRVEVLFPVEDAALQQHLYDQVLASYLLDTVNSWQLQPDGAYCKLQPGFNELGFDIQQHFINFYASQGVIGEPIAPPAV